MVVRSRHGLDTVSTTLAENGAFCMTNKGKMARAKGLQFERLVAIALRPIFPKARRHLECQAAEANGVDLVETGHYRIQCKRGRKYSSFSAIQEVTADELMGEIPVLITQGDHERILVAIPLEEFVALLKYKHKAV